MSLSQEMIFRILFCFFEAEKESFSFFWKKKSLVETDLVMELYRFVCVFSSVFSLTPLKIVHFKGFWDVHRGTGVLTHSQINKTYSRTPKGAMFFGGFLLPKTNPKKHGTK